MHNITYKNGVIESELLNIVNIHKPFHSRVDKIARRYSLSKLLVSPDDTRNSSQIKRFLIKVSKRYAYKMFASYKNDFKCHSIYQLNSSIDRILLYNVINTLIDETHLYPNLTEDLIKVIGLVVDAWDFDYLITDIPWLKQKFDIPIIVPKWDLLTYNLTADYGESVRLLFKRYKKIPLNLLPYEVLKNVLPENTNIDFPKCKCPLILMKSNIYYSGFLSNQWQMGLPATLFLA